MGVEPRDPGLAVLLSSLFGGAFWIRLMPLLHSPAKRVMLFRPHREGKGAGTDEGDVRADIT